MLSNLISPTLFITGILFMFWLVPADRIKNLFNLGLIGGLGIALVLVFIMQNSLGFWKFKQLDILKIGGIPIFLSATWIPVVIIFAYFVIKMETTADTIALILTFPFGATGLHYLFINYDLLNYSNWSLIYTFIVSLAIHFGITVYLYQNRFIINRD